MAVKSFSVLPTARSQACVFSVCGVLNMAAVAGTQWRSSCRYYLSLGKKRRLLFAGIIRSRGTACSAEEKADWLHILSVFVSVGLLSPPFLLWREEIFLRA